MLVKLHNWALSAHSECSGLSWRTCTRDLFLYALRVEDLEVTLERGKGSDGTPMSEEKFDKLDFLTYATQKPLLPVALLIPYETLATLQAVFL